MHIFAWKLCASHHQAGRKEELKEAAEREKLPYKSLIHINNSYEEMAKHGGVNFDAKLKSFAVIDGAAAADFDFGHDQLGIKNPNMFLHQTEDQKYEFLELSGQGLKYVPENVQKMFALSSLILSNNRLETIPETIAGLTNLMTLDVQSNQLQALPDAISSLKKLKKLNVSGNLLKVLPESIGSCRLEIPHDSREVICFLSLICLCSLDRVSTLVA